MTTVAAIEQRLIPLVDRHQWESTLDRVPHVFAHTWDNCSAMAAASGDPTYLYHFRSGEAEVVCPLAERRVDGHTDIVTPYGMSGFVGLGDDPSFAERWWEYAVANDYVCGYLLLNPVLSNEAYFGAAAQHHKTLFVIDLQLDEEALFARLSTNRKRQVRRATSGADEIATDRELLTEFFVEVYPDFMARRGAARVFRLGERTIRALCASPRVLPIGVSRDGRIRAVSLFGFTRHGGDYLFNASLPGEEATSAALIWAGVLAMKGHGVPSLNLGGGVADGDGVAEFKRRFGSEEVPLRNIKQIYRPDVYRQLCDRARVDASTTAYFPAYRAGQQ